MKRLFDILSQIISYPHIVESGTKNGWTYRKWSNGTVEAWIKNLSLGNITAAVWVSPIRYKDLTISIPSGLFNNAPTITAISATGQFWVVDVNATSGTGASVRLATMAQSEQAAYVNIYAKGS